MIRFGLAMMPPSLGYVADTNGIFFCNAKLANSCKAGSFTAPIIRFMLSSCRYLISHDIGRIFDLESYIKTLTVSLTGNVSNAICAPCINSTAGMLNFGSELPYLYKPLLKTESRYKGANTAIL